jgi:adenosylcobyric acid synthase
MIQGTGSGVGKSLITTALCRIFRDDGINVAPFKAQNMALNSYITQTGGEIGRAQALQAEAARIVPMVDMNPVLLKASGDMGSQVIIHGKAYRHMKAREYYAFRKEAWKAVEASFIRLSQNYDLIIMEGAGSPAEINLMDMDIVNMSASKLAKAPVILVGDIDKGGVFASIYGTVKLLGRDSRYIKAFIINKFRGDLEILRPGLEMIKKKTGKPVIGIMPYIINLELPEEDGLSLGQKVKSREQEAIKIVVVRLKYISNFTDFDPFACESDVELIYSTNPSDIENADLVILPGSKNTVKDLIFLKENHLDESIKRAYARGIRIIGICGGYQMLGKKIYDPHSVESSYKEMEGLGLLDIETLFGHEKTTSQVEAQLVQPSAFGIQGGFSELKAFEIHMGSSTGNIGLFKLRRLSNNNIKHQTSNSEFILDGSINGNCWGTYLHGIFENDLFRRYVINQIRNQKGFSALGSTVNYSRTKEEAINNLAKIVKENIDTDFIKRMLNL